ncbi:hypothetical protein K474DRAFT_366488 [Panus rudis PR-1116 ss-1]|nr:hypothetical protein K474DRAFT_366488 [Panus rudis PR-1116 ss-1]
MARERRRHGEEPSGKGTCRHIFRHRFYLSHFCLLEISRRRQGPSHSLSHYSLREFGRHTGYYNGMRGYCSRTRVPRCQWLPNIWSSTVGQPMQHRDDMVVVRSQVEIFGSRSIYFTSPPHSTASTDGTLVRLDWRNSLSSSALCSAIFIQRNRRRPPQLSISRSSLLIWDPMDIHLIPFTSTSRSMLSCYWLFNVFLYVIGDKSSIWQ